MNESADDTRDSVQYLICVSDFVVMRDLAEAIRSVVPAARIGMIGHVRALFAELPKLVWPGLVFLEGEPGGMTETELSAHVRDRSGKIVFLRERALDAADRGREPVLFLPFRSEDVRRLHRDLIGKPETKWPWGQR